MTQEHHVFVGTFATTSRSPRPHADDDELRAALEAVGRDRLGGLAAGRARHRGRLRRAPGRPAQAQQLALARIVLADPHTLVLDEATSLLDPRAARHLERSLAAVLDGRTVVAIAHRLHTAHDADRVAVVEDGRITELGTHDGAGRRRRRLRRVVGLLARHRGDGPRGDGLRGARLWPAGSAHDPERMRQRVGEPVEAHAADRADAVHPLDGDSLRLRIPQDALPAVPPADARVLHPAKG